MADIISLPSAYKKVNYIQAKSYAFIDTQYTPVQDDEIEVEYMIDSISSYNCLFSAGTGTYQLIALGYKSSSKQNYYVKYFSNGGAAELKSQSLTNQWKTLTVSSSGVFTTNSKTITNTYKNQLDGANTTLYIFRRRESSYPFIGKLRSFKIINNNTLKLNLIPCIRLIDNIAGVYDTVSEQFFSSASPNESFTAAPENVSSNMLQKWYNLMLNQSHLYTVNNNSFSANVTESKIE